MTRAGLLVLLTVLPAAAAPLPDEERERREVARVYGTWVDPHNRGTPRVVGSELRVRLPGELTEFVRDLPHLDGAARYVREVEGDFTASVRVVGLRLVGGVEPVRGELGCGLAAEDAAGKRAALRWHAPCARNPLLPLDAGWTEAVKQWPGGMHWDFKETGAIYLRLARVGPYVSFGYSWDGLLWNDTDPQAVGWAASVRVGPFARNLTTAPAEVVFDRYSLTQPKN